MPAPSGLRGRRRREPRVVFPDPVYPGREFYRAKYREFPLWYRLYLRLRSLVGSRTVEIAARAHHLQELRRRLDRVGRGLVDCGVPALLPGFHQRVRALAAQLKRIRPSLDESTGAARGSFLIHALEHRSPELAQRLREAGRLSEEERSDPTLTSEEARKQVGARLEAELEREFPAVKRRLESIWLALRTLNLLQRVDLAALLPVEGAHRQQTPLRVVQEPLQQLHQAMELAQTHSLVVATEEAWEFARQRIRSQPGPARSVWSEITEFRAAVPLLELVRYAAGEPFLEVPALTITSDWWGPFRRAMRDRSVGGVVPQLLTQRERALDRALTRVFGVERPGPGWIPATLYPRTVAALVRLGSSDYFHDTRRVISQLVIEADFYDLDLRDRLHQAAVDVDQALEELRTLLGDGQEKGTLGEEILRLRQRSSVSSLVHRQLTTLYERYRPRVRQATESAIDAVRTAGAILAAPQEGRQQLFLFDALHNPSFSGEYSVEELLSVVGSHWLPLSEELHGLYRLETELKGRPGQADPDIPGGEQ